MSRPALLHVLGVPANGYVPYGNKLTIIVGVPSLNATLTAVFLDLGFSTHALHMSQRLVQLSVTQSLAGTHLQAVVTMPPNPSVYPPGPGWLYILANGVPSVGYKVTMGTGVVPFNAGALAKSVFL